MQIGERDAFRAELTAAAAAFAQMGMQFWLDKAEAALEAQH